MSDLVLGAVVRWPSAPGQPVGVIHEVDGPRVKVRFDGESTSKIFNARAGVLERVELTGMVLRVSTGSVGLLQGLATPTPPRWQVIMDGRLSTIAEADLRPHVLETPQAKMLERRLGKSCQFSLATTTRRIELESLSSELVALGEARVDIKPHQVSVAHRVISDYPHRFLLCDEVGLGKTIEAGMILKELRARGAAQRTIIVVPPNLVRQWQFELKSKFNESFSVINRDTVRYLRSVQGFDGNPFEIHDSVLVSSAWITGKEWSAFATAVPWDMVIVDEAHHVRVRGSGPSRRETKLYKTVRELVSPDAFSKRAALLLTATPMQLESTELYSLVELLDPALFPTDHAFEAHRASLPGLNRLVHELSEHGFPLPDDPDESVVEQVSEWLEVPPSAAEKRLRGGPDELAALCEDLSSQHLLSEILIRNRKKLVGGFMPRQAHRWEVELSPAEKAAIDAVDDYVREGYARAEREHNNAVGFVMVVFQKLMASSIRALRTSLDRRRQRLLDQAETPTLSRRMEASLEAIGARLDDDETLGAILAELAEAHAGEAAELGDLVALLDRVPVDSKADVLLAQLSQLVSHEPAAKVLLFTEFRETQEYLRERLESSGWNVQLFHGQLKPDAKDAAVEAFRTATEPSILLSTEAGGEGRNFQFCHLLVNFDLPWNPMRVEQRIGRVDRLGQEHVVQVFNLWVKGTVEERILDVLERRINVFEETVGGLDPILGDTEKDLTKIFQLSGDERDRALTRLENRLEKSIAEARQAEERLRDFIMETKSYSGEIATMISAAPPIISSADQELLIRRLLKDAGTRVEANADGTFQVTFHEPFVSDHPEHVKEGHRTRTVAFRRDVMPDSEHVEYMAFGHPIVDDLVADVTAPSYRGTAAAFQVDDAGLAPTHGWMLVYELGVPGLPEVRELCPLFVHDFGAVDPKLGELLIDRMVGLQLDHDLQKDTVPVEELDTAAVLAEPIAFERLSALENRSRNESTRRIDRERQKLQGYFDYREQAALDRLAASRATLLRLETDDTEDRRRIIPVWRANVARDERLIEQLAEERQRQLDQLTSRASGQGDLTLFAAARVEIVPPATAIA